MTWKATKAAAMKVLPFAALMTVSLPAGAASLPDPVAVVTTICRDTTFSDLRPS
jgi:hypothetical protein